MSLQKEVWVAGIKENPIPDHSFVNASTNMSEYVENNILHLAEAGIEPTVYENWFENSENPLPLNLITDIPHQVSLNKYSSEQTRSRKLQDVELAYDKRESLINRHKTSLAKNIGKRASFAWTAAQSNAFNKVIDLGKDDSIIDAIIDLQAFYAALDKPEFLNICMSPLHMARIRREDLRLYKEIMSEKGANIYGFRIYSYSQTPIFTADGIKKPFDALFDAGDRRCSFTWATDEVFRCFGTVEMYAKIGDPAIQADVISFAQRALVGNIRANNPKYLGVIV